MKITENQKREIVIKTCSEYAEYAEYATTLSSELLKTELDEQLHLNNYDWIKYDDYKILLGRCINELQVVYNIK